MATVQTFKSISTLQIFLNTITLPVQFDVLGKRGYFTFVSVSDVVGGGPNSIVIFHLKSETQLEDQLNSLSGNADVLRIIPFGGHWIVIAQTTGTTIASNVVTTYKSPDALTSGTGLVVVPGLDDSTVVGEYAVGDVVVSYGANYTIIKAVPGGTTILSKGGFYTVIVIS